MLLLKERLALSPILLMIFFFRSLIASSLLSCLLACTVQSGDSARSIQEQDLDGSFKIHRDIEYSRRENLALVADIYVPKGAGPFPAVLLIHGGSWSGGDKWMMNSTAKLLAKSGFVAINIEYSFAPKHTFPAQFEDCENAISWIKKNSAKYQISPDKIGVWGYSAGAHLSALLGTRSHGDIKAVVGGAGPYDLLLYPHDKTVNKFLGTTIEKNPRIFREASPLYNITAQTPPMFLYHGSWDDIVDPKHSIKMHEALNRAGITSDLYWIRGLGHIPLFIFGRFAEKKAVKFLKFHLKH